MKRQILLQVFLLFMFSVSAQSSDQKWGIGIGSGVYGSFDKNSLGYMPEVIFSRYLSPSFDASLTGNLGLANNKIVSKLDLVTVGLHVHYKLYNGLILPETSRLKPYLYGGPGYIWDNDGESLNLDGGLGVKYNIKHNVSLYAQGGYILGASVEPQDLPGGDKTRENLWKAVVGIQLTIGASKDSDGDGVPDKKDKCPNTPRDIFVDEHGCPIDTDGDGVIDHLDECPTEPGLTSTNGCPDEDKDGIPDKDDACPDKKGTKANNGCPDPESGKADAKETDPSKMTAAEAIESGNTRVLDIKVKPVYFVVDRSNLTSFSKNKIANLVEMLLKNPVYLVRLWGYTDDLASDEYNQKLSEKRAESVMRFMTSMGFDRSRIVATNGMGEANPAAPNNSEQNRKLNRRVEFEIFVAE
jgi:outer membrane protein OmpA-like peptidoglycan-associated protein